MSLLRTYVRLLLVEDENVLKRWISREGSPLEVALAQKGAVPVKRGKADSSVLGEGSYNKVIEVVYKGKRAAARCSTLKEELDSLKTFMKYKEIMLPEHQKHFPVVYDTFDLDTKEGSWFVAIVELLDPLPPGLKHDLEVQPTNGILHRSRVDLLINDESIAQEIADGFNNRDDLLEMYKDAIEPTLMSLVGESIMDIQPTLQQATAKYWSRQNRYRFIQLIASVLRNSVIPNQRSLGVTKNKTVADVHPSKKVREFYDFLKELQDLGLEWADMHTDNFMVRRSTNDLVVVDPGFFVEG